MNHQLLRRAYLIIEDLRKEMSDNLYDGDIDKEEVEKLVEDLEKAINP